MRLKEQEIPKTSGDLVRAFVQSGQAVMEVLDDEGNYKSIHIMYSSLYNYLRRNRELYPNVKVYYRKGHCYLKRTDHFSPQGNQK